MIQPCQCDKALLADIAAAPRDEGALSIWWLGQSGFLVQWAGERFLFDPYLSDSLTRKYAATDKPHVRMTERCIDPALLTGISWATASHAHTDHLDAETLVPLALSNPGLRLCLPHPIVDEARKRLGAAAASVNFRPLSDGQVLKEGRWEIHGVIAKHNEVVRDQHGHSACIGFVVKCGPFTLYHSGDTLWHDDIVQTLRQHRCDVAFLPINGNRPERRVAGNLNGTEAAALAKAGGVRLVLPCHYDMFEFNTETPEEFVNACGRLGQTYRVMRCGERIEIRTDEGGV